MDLQAPVGTIVYFKASLTGKESTDVKTYQKRHGVFPHEATIEQWFSESQFEAYRKLGHQTVMSSFREAGSGDKAYGLVYQALKNFGFDIQKLGRPAQKVMTVGLG